MAVKIKRRARADLLAIRKWSEANWGEKKAVEFLEGLIEAIERLQEFPDLGRARPAFHPKLRSTRYKGYAIFYVIDTDEPVIVAVLHEARNHAALSFADRIGEA